MVLLRYDLYVVYVTGVCHDKLTPQTDDNIPRPRCRNWRFPVPTSEPNPGLRRIAKTPYDRASRRTDAEQDGRCAYLRNAVSPAPQAKGLTPILYL